MCLPDHISDPTVPITQHIANNDSNNVDRPLERMYNEFGVHANHI